MITNRLNLIVKHPQLTPNLLKCLALSFVLLRHQNWINWGYEWLIQILVALWLIYNVDHLSYFFIMMLTTAATNATSVKYKKH